MGLQDKDFPLLGAKLAPANVEMRDLTTGGQPAATGGVVNPIQDP